MCVLALCKDVVTVNVVCAHICWDSQFHIVALRRGRFGSRAKRQTHLPFHLPCLVTRENTDGRLLGTTRSGPNLQSITRATVPLGGASEALAATPLNTSGDSICGTRRGPVTLPEARSRTA